MKVVVVGCGGVGGVIAAHLTRAGEHVTPVTGNAGIAAALAAGGYRVTEHDGQSWTVAPSVTPLVTLPAPGAAAGGADVGAAGAGAAVGPFDLCIMATKSTTLAGALAEVKPWLAPGAAVVVCQNGLPEAVAAEVVGAGRVLGCIVVWGASMTAPGEYLRTSRGTFKLGRAFPEGPDPAPVAAVLEKLAPVELVDDLAAMRWSKLAINCATSTLGAIGGEKLGPLLRRRFVRRLVLELWSEVVEVARAAGVKPAPVAGVNLSLLSLSAAERRLGMGSPLLAGKHALIMAVGVKYRRLRSSMLIALERGRTPEIDYLNGEIVRRGAALGVPTPVNARLVRAVMDIVDGREKSDLAHLRRVYDELMERDERLAA